MYAREQRKAAAKYGGGQRRTKILHSYYTLIVYRHISVGTTMDVTSNSDF